MERKKRMATNPTNNYSVWTTWPTDTSSVTDIYSQTQLSYTFHERSDGEGSIMTAPFTEKKLIHVRREDKELNPEAKSFVEKYTKEKFAQFENRNISSIVFISIVLYIFRFFMPWT